MGKSKETLIVNQQVVQSIPEKQGKPHTKATRQYKFITYQQALDNLGKSPNKNTEYFLNETDDEKAKEFIGKVTAVISKYISGGTVERTRLRGRKEQDAFTLWMLLKDNKGELKIDETFLSQFRNDGDLKVTAVTFLTSSEEIRGYRISIGEKGVRLHEIINGSFKIVFDWQVGGEDFSITVDVSSDGKVTYSNLNKDLDIQDLEKNKDVKIQIGKGKKMTLAELVCLDPCMQKGVSKETLKIKEEKPLTSSESTGAVKPETNVIVSPPLTSSESTGAVKPETNVIVSPPLTSSESTGAPKPETNVIVSPPSTSLESTGAAKPETNVIVSPPSTSLESTGATQTNAKKASLGT